MNFKPFLAVFKHPIQTLFPFLSLVVAFSALVLTKHEINETTKIRKATLTAQVLEKLEIVSEKDRAEEHRATHTRSDVMRCSGFGKQLSQTAHIPLFKPFDRVGKERS